MIYLLHNQKPGVLGQEFTFPSSQLMQEPDMTGMPNQVSMWGKALNFKSHDGFIYSLSPLSNREPRSRCPRTVSELHAEWFCVCCAARVGDLFGGWGKMGKLKAPLKQTMPPFHDTFSRSPPVFSNTHFIYRKIPSLELFVTRCSFNS
jgi:hypothetical protein